MKVLASALIHGFVYMVWIVLLGIVAGLLIEYWVWLWGVLANLDPALFWLAFVPLALAPIAWIIGTLLAPSELAEGDVNLQKGSENG